MKIAITTPTGHIGHTLTRLLLKHDAELVLLARHPEKLEEFNGHQVEIRQGQLEDETYLQEATQDVESLFWLTPPNYQSDSLRAYQDKLGHLAAEAIAKNNLNRVVDLSSVGAQHTSGTGPVKGLHDVEEILETAASNITHLRAAFFFENFMMQINALKNGQIFMPTQEQSRIAMISTHDIAKVAADCLLDQSWRGRRVIAIEGPQTLTFAEAAAEISEGLGREVKFIHIEDEEAKKNLTQMGISENFAKELIELYHSIDSGQMDFEGDETAHIHTRTTLRDFAEQIMKPAIQQLGIS